MSALFNHQKHNHNRLPEAKSRNHACMAGGPFNALFVERGG